MNVIIRTSERFIVVILIGGLFLNWTGSKRNPIGVVFNQWTEKKENEKKNYKEEIGL